MLRCNVRVGGKAGRAAAACIAALALAWTAGCGDSDDNSAKDDAVAHVHSAAVTLGADLQGIPDQFHRIAHIRQTIDPIRFYEDNSGYFYVYDFNCVNVAHATQKNLVGQSLVNFTDSHGKFVIRELAAAARNGGGFVEYYWVKPGVQGEKLKIGYVEQIPGTDYFIGSGVYVE